VSQHGQCSNEQGLSVGSGKKGSRVGKKGKEGRSRRSCGKKRGKPVKEPVDDRWMVKDTRGGKSG